jgi:pyruvate,water dikinase
MSARQSVIVPLPEAAGHPGAGGKARGLGALIAAGFAVPEGFVAMPEARREEIVAAYRIMGSGRVAVRSSAAEEDSEYLSYAGQFDTFLNVDGEEALLEAVAACRASIEGRRASGYRQGFADVAANPPSGVAATSGMAVVVQRMIDADYAGVAFVEAGGQACVEGVAGLGEALVSGRSSPAALPAELRSRVEQLGREVSARLGGSQDVEWAAEGGRIWLLQARPLTAPLPSSLPEKLRLWTGANVQEAVPRALTPLSEELIRDFLNRLFGEHLRFGGFEEPSERTTLLMNGRLYMSYSEMGSLMSAMPGFRMEQLLQLFGDPPELGPLIEYRQASRARFLLRLPRFLGGLAAWNLLARRRLRRGREALERLGTRFHQPLTGGRDALADADLARLIADILDDRAGIIRMIAICTGVAFLHLNSLTQAGRALSLPAVPVSELGNAGRMESLEPAQQLAALGRWLREHPDCGEDHPEVRRRLARFIDTCGFRGENEAELAGPRWAEQPEKALEIARQLAGCVETGTSAGRDEEKESVGSGTLRTPHSALRTPHVPWWARLLLWPLARGVRVWQPRREESRAILSRRLMLLRRLLLEAGRRAPCLAQSDDIFYLLRNEVEALLSGQAPPDIAARVAQRRERHRTLLARPAPARLLVELPGGRLAPFELESGGSEELRGFGVSPGRVTAPARVISDFSQAAELQAGEVLVTRTTDVAWTPIFQLAAAVVTEIGAPTSHAAIVARELGVPAVVNVLRATEQIQTGDLLFVDGWAGRVSKVTSDK